MKSRKISAILALTLLVFLYPFVSSCRDPLPHDYRASAFFAEIRYECGSEAYCAEVKVGSPSETGNARDIEIRFTSPPALVGLCVSQKGGMPSVTLGSADVKSQAAADRFLSIAKLLIADGNMKFVEKLEENGLVFYKAEISDTDKTLSLLLDVNGAPNRISCGDITLTVIRFE